MYIQKRLRHINCARYYTVVTGPMSTADDHTIKQLYNNIRVVIRDYNNIICVSHILYYCFVAVQWWCFTIRRIIIIIYTRRYYRFEYRRLMHVIMSRVYSLTLRTPHRNVAIVKGIELHAAIDLFAPTNVILWTVKNIELVRLFQSLLAVVFYAQTAMIT